MAQWAIYSPEGGFGSDEALAAVPALIDKTRAAMQEAAAVLPVGTTIRLLSEEQFAELSTPAECSFIPESSDEEGGATPKAE